ncbi:hypothetical protein U1Q18_032959 [Sarracenia purpurea var. burkii]
MMKVALVRQGKNAEAKARALLASIRPSVQGQSSTQDVQPSPSAEPIIPLEPHVTILEPHGPAQASLPSQEPSKDSQAQPHTSTQPQPKAKPSESFQDPEIEILNPVPIQILTVSQQEVAHPEHTQEPSQVPS